MNYIYLSVVFLLLNSGLQAEEWVADFQPIQINAHKRNNSKLTKIAEKLDFGGTFKTIEGMEVLHLRVRNGYHKMGALKIQVKHHEFEGYFVSNRQNFFIPIDTIDLNNSGRTCVLEFFADGSKYKVWVEIESGKIQEKFIATKES